MTSKLDLDGLKTFKSKLDTKFALKGHTHSDYVTNTTLNAKLSEISSTGSVTVEETDPIFSASAAAGITSSDITNWNSKTSNTGTYSKPSSGIPKTDLASAVQTSLGKADTALQSYTETDPVFSASAAAGITSTDISNWNAKTSNTGTVTSVNNTSPVNGNVTISIPSAVTESTVSGWGFTKNTGTLTSESDPVFTASPAYGITSANITSWNSKTSNTGTVTSVNNVSPVNGNVTLSIPSEVTESTVSGWGFTKNTGTLTSESDPVFQASAAYAITSTDISNWNSKTSNTGTITGITMNGASKGTSGVVDLGTVVTSLSGYVPTTRTVNSKALSSDITLSASDVGAAASSHTHTGLWLNANTTTYSGNGTASTCTWGTLTSSNSYTNSFVVSTSTGGGICFADKSTQTSMQIDGTFYQGEGKNAVLDTTSTLDATKLSGTIPTSCYSNTTYSAGTGLSLSGTTFSNAGVTSFNGSTGAVTATIPVITSGTTDLEAGTSSLTSGTIYLVYE